MKLLSLILLSISQPDTTQWAGLPTIDRIYHQSLVLQNARHDFYSVLRLYVEYNGTKELRVKARMTEKNFLRHLQNGTFTPVQIRAMMQDMVTVYPANMYGIDISKEEERIL